jgi:Tol biopolymer transport system component
LADAKALPEVYAAIITFRAGVRRHWSPKRRGETLYGVAFRRADLLRMSMVTTAALLVACLLALVGTTKPAGATFPGVNGKIAFSRDRGGDSDGDAEIYRMNADGSHLTRLTNNSVDDTQPDWSPDGTKIAFMSGVHKGSNLEIYTMNADGTKQTRLTNDPHGDAVPAWSPDGTKIAFVSDRGNDFEIEEIYVMNADGTEPTNISNLTVGVGLPIVADSEPSWSPDGTQIAFRCYVLNGGGRRRPNA